MSAREVRTTKLVIVRHGNTFDRGEVPLRIGVRTDMPLSSSGREQAVLLGRYLRQAGIRPSAAFSSKLERAWRTAELAFGEAAIDCSLERLEMFNEIDYGPDEAKTEEEVIARVGQEAMDLWNKSALVPRGWLFNPEVAVENWRNFAEMAETSHREGVIMVFTSNGIARFAPHLTGDFEKFSRDYDIKMSTGALSILEKGSSDSHWRVVSWNLRPKDYLQPKE
ncbi:MAG: histidine phosphatase family protein [Rickettsiales bacterium]|jgi:probable phosphoglycerate mutase|nr:histidine phosphatase family protein [Rickettsiales bacterium]